MVTGHSLRAPQWLLLCAGALSLMPAHAQFSSVGWIGYQSTLSTTAAPFAYNSNCSYLSCSTPGDKPFTSAFDSDMVSLEGANSANELSVSSSATVNGVIADASFSAKLGASERSISISAVGVAHFEGPPQLLSWPEIQAIPDGTDNAADKVLFKLYTESQLPPSASMKSLLALNFNLSTTTDVRFRWNEVSGIGGNLHGPDEWTGIVAPATQLPFSLYVFDFSQQPYDSAALSYGGLRSVLGSAYNDRIKDGEFIATLGPGYYTMYANPGEDFRPIDGTLRQATYSYSLTMDALTAVPEPSTSASLLLGLAGLALVCRRRQPQC
jgi:PEP-CTERM motif